MERVLLKLRLHTTTANQIVAVPALMVHTYPCDGHGRLGHVDPRRIFSERIVFHQQPHQVPPGQELHHHIQVHVVLKNHRRDQQRFAISHTTNATKPAAY